MKAIILIVLVAFTSANSLSEAFKAEVYSISLPKPLNSEKLVSYVRATASQNSAVFRIENIDTELSKFNLPSDFIVKAKSIAFSAAVDFRTFNFVVESSQTVFSQIVCALRNLSGEVNFAYYLVNSTGSPIKQYIYERRTAPIKNDWGQMIWIPQDVAVAERGYTTQELEDVKNALRFEAYVILRNVFNPVPQEGKTVLLNEVNTVWDYKKIQSYEIILDAKDKAESNYDFITFNIQNIESIVAKYSLPTSIIQVIRDRGDASFKGFSQTISLNTSPPATSLKCVSLAFRRVRDEISLVYLYGTASKTLVDSSKRKDGSMEDLVRLMHHAYLVKMINSDFNDQISKIAVS